MPPKNELPPEQLEKLLVATESGAGKHVNITDKAGIKKILEEGQKEEDAEQLADFLEEISPTMPILPVKNPDQRK